MINHLLNPSLWEVIKLAVALAIIGAYRFKGWQEWLAQKTHVRVTEKFFLLAATIMLAQLFNHWLGGLVVFALVAFVCWRKAPADIRIEPDSEFTKKLRSIQATIERSGPTN